MVKEWRWLFFLTLDLKIFLQFSGMQLDFSTILSASPFVHSLINYSDLTILRIPQPSLISLFEKKLMDELFKLFTVVLGVLPYSVQAHRWWNINWHYFRCNCMAYLSLTVWCPLCFVCFLLGIGVDCAVLPFYELSGIYIGATQDGPPTLGFVTLSPLIFPLLVADLSVSEPVFIAWSAPCWGDSLSQSGSTLSSRAVIVRH